MSRRGDILLRLALACFILSLGVIFYSSPGSISSAFLKYSSIRTVEKYLFFAFLLILISPSKKLLKIGGLTLSGVMAFDAIFKFSQFSPVTNLLAPMTSAMRIIFPLIVADILTTKSTNKILRFACALTFIGHGLEAFIGVGKFVDYILYLNQTLGEALYLSEESAKVLLKAIGSLDIIFSILLFSKYKRLGLKFMVFWGAATGLMRIIYYDFSFLGFNEFFYRIPHWIIPLMLLAYSDEK